MDCVLFGRAAVMAGITGYELDRLAKAHAFPFQMAGRFRCVRAEDIALVKAAAIAAGYLATNGAE